MSTSFGTTGTYSSEMRIYRNKTWSFSSKLFGKVCLVKTKLSGLFYNNSSFGLICLQPFFVWHRPATIGSLRQGFLSPNLNKRVRTENEQISVPLPDMDMKMPPMKPTPRSTRAFQQLKFGIELCVFLLYCLEKVQSLV